MDSGEPHKVGWIEIWVKWDMDENAEETWRSEMQRKSRMFGGKGRMGGAMNRIYREQVGILRNGSKMWTKSWKHGGLGQKRG